MDDIWHQRLQVESCTLHQSTLVINYIHAGVLYIYT